MSILKKIWSWLVAKFNEKHEHCLACGEPLPPERQWHGICWSCDAW